MKRFLQKDFLIGLFLATVAFIVFRLTSSNSVDSEDCGEIATALATLGIVHPTGYPLFTMLGWAFSHVPLEDRIILRLDLLVAIICAVAVYFFYRLFLFLLSPKGRRLFTGKLPDSSTASLSSDRFAAAITTLLLAFSRTFWSEGVSLEVYAFHLFFLSVVTLLFLKALSEKIGSGAHAKTWWIAFAVVLGFSFTNHMMTVLLAPAFLYLYFTVHGFGRSAWIKIGKTAIPFLLPLSLYLYLPIRSSQKPIMNWGEPNTWKRFWEHFTAAQYHEQMYSSIHVAETKLVKFFQGFPSEFAYWPLLFLFLGVVFLFRRSWKLLVFCVLIFVGCLFYSVNYNFDDPNFYLNAYVAAAICMVFGIRFLLEKTEKSAWRWLGRLLGVVFVIVVLWINYPLSDQSQDYAVEDYAKNMLNSVDSGGILFSNEYERLASPAFYLQLVEKYRPDVVILDITLFANPWYYGHLEMRYPWLIQQSRRSIDDFLTEEDRFSRGKIHDTVAYNAKISEMFKSFLEQNYGKRPVYVSSGINPAVLVGYQRVPSGMVFRVLRDSDSAIIAPMTFRFHPLPDPRADPLAEKIRSEYAEGYGNQGAYRITLGDTATGIAFLRKALSIQPNFPQAIVWLRLAGENESGTSGEPR
jgi:hypothetical protein